ncbi:probable serine/threonine-protein kinase ndrD [Aplysia californica]|uniref:Probable serine/threonine-protein kinase ndrD n=1 Tax=Aplysia californica TaxID=6500 RepID=A0ABM0JVS6_APLCA|nr:probable serine/threonine-protein kinase ndrD [Aplysia californica]
MLNMANEFNNNNYLPGFPSDISAATFAHVLPTALHFRSGSVPQNSFTFTTPTQCNTSATPRPCIQTTSRISNLSAPGVGASWQHSIPTTMPWVATQAVPMRQVGLGNASLFTGIPSHINVPSCSSPIKRPKRRALDEPNEAPSSKVYLCLDKFANLHISPSEHSRDVGTAASYADQTENINSIWQHFQEIENRLDEELEEDVNTCVDPGNTQEDGPVLKVADGILDVDKHKKLVSAEPILPREVIAEVQKPCMQLVLWQSPAAAIREFLKCDDPQSNSSVVVTTSSSNLNVSSQNTCVSPSNNRHNSNNKNFLTSTNADDSSMDVNVDDGGATTEKLSSGSFHERVVSRGGFCCSPSSTILTQVSSCRVSSSCEPSMFNVDLSNRSQGHIDNNCNNNNNNNVMRTSRSGVGVGLGGEHRDFFQTFDDQEMQQS